jgi:hypothetical protein
MMSSTTLKRRLSTLDVGFLYAERPGQSMHVGSCLPSEGHISRDELIRQQHAGHRTIREYAEEIRGVTPVTV